MAVRQSGRVCTTVQFVRHGVSSMLNKLTVYGVTIVVRHTEVKTIDRMTLQYFFCANC
jgi:hypothetical protein